MLRKLIQVVFIVACWGGLVFVSIQTMHEPTIQTTENRTLTAKPDLPNTWRNADEYVKQLESWWNDSIHYRQYFIRISALMRMSVGINPHGQVLVGKDGWFFWTGERSDEAFRNNAPLTEQEVLQWKSYLRYRHEEAKKNGATYYFVVMPNKERVYAEHMPDNFQVIGQQSWLDQIAESLKGEGVNIIDLREALHAAKQNTQIYTKTDTHWNLMGANYAQYEISRILAEKYPLLEPHLYPEDAFYLAEPLDFVKAGVNYYTGLPHMLGISDTVNELQPLFKKTIKNCTRPASIPLKPNWESVPEPTKSITFHATQCADRHYRVLFLRDSFTELLEHFTSETFQYVAYIWLGTPLNMESWSYFLETTDPDIVIDQLIDRYLTHIPQPGIDYPIDTNP